MRTTCALLVTGTLLVAACGGEDETTTEDVAATTVATTVTTTAAPASTASPPTSATESTGDLEAWCLGWIEGSSIDLGGDEAAERSAMDAIEADTAAMVPADLREAWTIYESGAGPESTEWRLALRDIEQYWVTNCDIQIGTKITQP